MADNEHIEISFDDEPETAARPIDDDRLVITTDDLLTVAEPAEVVYPGLSPGAGGPMVDVGFPEKGKGAAVTQVLGSVLWQSALAGMLGGFLAWLCTEWTFNRGGEGDVRHVLLTVVLFGGLLGSGIGVVLGAVEGIVGRVYQKALLGGLLGLLIGFAGGFIGGFVGQIIYSVMGGGEDNNFVLQIVARTIGWAALGACVGLGQGVAIRSGRKILNGLLGGLIGGAIGGLLFDVVASVFRTGTTSRAVAITILGAFAGIAIGMVEELSKQAWLRITQGPMAGKEFILYHASTTIGSSPKCEITIPKDTAILPQHCVIRSTGGHYTLSSIDQRAPAFVNGRPVQQTALRNGDSIQLGYTMLFYSERAERKNGAPASPSYPGGYGGR